VRGFTQETTTALLTMADNAECMRESYKIPGNIASITDECSFSMVKYRLVYFLLFIYSAWVS